jgi:hypothetical protein
MEEGAPLSIVKVDDPHCDAGWYAERSFQFFYQRPCSMCQKALSVALGALAVFGVGLAVARASFDSSCTNFYTQGIAVAQGSGSSRCGCAHRACPATDRQMHALKGTIAQVNPGEGGGPIRPVLLSEIESRATISVARGVTLDFSDGGANNVMVDTSDNPSVVQITSKTNAVTIAPGTAHLGVANIGQCPKPKGAQSIACSPVLAYTLTINVQNQP